MSQKSRGDLTGRPYKLGLVKRLPRPLYDGLAMTLFCVIARSPPLADGEAISFCSYLMRLPQPLCGLAMTLTLLCLFHLVFLDHLQKVFFRINHSNVNLAIRKDIGWSATNAFGLQKFFGFIDFLLAIITLII